MSDYEPPVGSAISLRFRLSYEDKPVSNAIGLEFVLGNYIPPFGDSIALDFEGNGYTPPIGSTIPLKFNEKNSVIGPDQYLFPLGSYHEVVTQPDIKNEYHYFKPVGFSQGGSGSPSIRNNLKRVTYTGWQSSATGTPISVFNFNQAIYPSSFTSSVFSSQKIYNLKQFLRAKGSDSQALGYNRLFGGRRWLYPYGFESMKFGLAATADQYANPVGIASLGMGVPSVSPRMLYPAGINAGLMGIGHDIRTPVLLPDGFVSSKAGTPTIWFHTRPLAPAGKFSYESGFPAVFDPTQFIQAQSLITSAIFGDTATRNQSLKVNVLSINYDSFSDYTAINNTNRYYQAKGFDSQAMGVPAIVNNTPSIFVDSIEPYDVGTPALGLWIRYLQPSGIIQQGLGRPTLTKTPELLPVGYQSSAVSNPTVWYKNRTVRPVGIDSVKYGVATLWFRYRYLSAQGWSSSAVNAPTLTHGVREVIAQGFRHDVLGISWVSRGTRYLEPPSIYEPKNSNHMVGGTQTVMPAGYEATLWGERIVPVDTKVFPLGFAGAVGLAEVSLYIRNIAPIGYISVGQQPADRWGNTELYNSTQYITQEYDVNSALTPPKWSDWLLIENRNKTIGATGLNSQKFGYSQIDNNAAPLLPTGISPPIGTRFDVSMIAHGIRYLPLQGIEPPLISDWGVVYNAARPLSPTGAIHTEFGEHGAVNTRRYYRDWGRLDSLEMGEPAIGYRIRTIDIEPRYSIAPPQINLPTIHLYNSYVTFRGYETAKYGTPFIEEHFSILYPKWTHKEKFGEGVVYNSTPEYAAYGHDSSEFGDTAIRTEWRNLYAQGSDTSLFGAVAIADTKREIKVAGWLDSRASQLHKVIKMGTNPYTTQNIFLNNESRPNDDGGGIPIPNSQVGIAGINQNVLYPAGINSQRFGTAFTWSNNIYIDTGIPIQSMDAGPVVTNKKRFLSPAGIDAEIKVSNFARVSPSYLFQWHDQYSATTGERFGQQIVTNQDRQIYPSSRVYDGDHLRAGTPAIELSTRYIEPKAIRQFLFGVPELPFTPKEVLPYGALSEVFGLTMVKYPPYIGPQTVSAAGINSLSAGTPVIDLFNRYVGAIGYNSQSMGGSIPNDTPYMWQGLRVGEFVPMEIGAGDTSLFGNARISLRVQSINLEGFVAFRSEYDYTNFEARMKVVGTITDYVTAQSIAINGINSEAMGSPSIKLGQHFIRPDGNSDQYRKGGYHA